MLTHEAPLLHLPGCSSAKGIVRGSTHVGPFNTLAHQGIETSNNSFVESITLEMDKPDVTDARSAENPKKIGKFVIGLFVAFVVVLVIVLLFFLHHAPIVQR